MKSCHQPVDSVGASTARRDAAFGLITAAAANWSAFWYLLPAFAVIS
jgi:hypothetical protein